MPKIFKKSFHELNKKNLLAFALILFAAFFFWSSIAFRDFFYGLVALLEKFLQTNPRAGILIFIALSAFSAMLSPFSSVPLVPMAILLWGNFLTFLMIWVGWSLGGAAAYYVGKDAAYHVLKKFIDTQKIDYYSKKFSRKTSFWTILLFRSSLPAEIPGYALGILRYDFIKYQIATSLAELPFAIATVYASQALLAGQKIYFTFWLAAGLLSMSIAFYYFQKKLFKNN